MRGVVWGSSTMRLQPLSALLLALSFPALAQTQPQLEPLVPGTAVPEKKPAPRKRAKPPAADSKKPASAQTEPAVPELVPLTPARGDKSLGILVVGALPERAGEALRAVVKLAPSVKEVVMLEAPPPCTNEACWLVAGAAANVDQVVVAMLSGTSLRVRVIDVAKRRQVSQARQDRVSKDAAELTAWSQALACKLLVPAGCTGEVRVDAPASAELLLNGQPLGGGERRMVPVGVHTVRVKEGTAVSSRRLAVVYEDKAAPPAPPPEPAAGPPLALPPSVAAAAPAPSAAPPVAASAPAPAAAVTAAPAPAPKRSWTKTAGYVTAGAAVAAAAAGAYFGVKSKSDLDKAESAYRANGSYQPADLDALNSGNSKAHTANALFVASAVLLAGAAALTFAF